MESVVSKESKIVENLPVKAGYKTTEGWANLGASSFAMMNLPPELAAQFVMALQAVYMICRAITKAFQGRKVS